MAKTNRKIVVDTAKTIAKKMRGGRYDVRRGAFNWATYTFPKNYALSILIDKNTFLRGMNRMTMTLEIFMRNREEADLTDIDDTGMEELHDDVDSFFTQLIMSTNENGDSVVLEPLKDSDTATEVSDSDKKVQGIVASVTFTY